MKYLGFVLVLGSILVGCAAHHYYVPEGYKTCRYSGDCPRGYHCGFVGVDTYPVCKP